MKLLWNTEKPLGELALDPELAQLFPAAPLADIERLAADITAGAVLPPLVAGAVSRSPIAPTGTCTLTDGHTRLAAYHRAGRTPRARVPVMVYQYDTRAEQLEHAIVLNALRRHLSTEQRAAYAVQLAQLRQAAPAAAPVRATPASPATPTAPNASAPAAPTPSGFSESLKTPRQPSALEQAAADVGVGAKTAQAYKRIQDNGIGDLRLAVREKKLSIEAAAKIAAHPAADQADLLEVALHAAEAAKKSRQTWRKERRHSGGGQAAAVAGHQPAISRPATDNAAPAAASPPPDPCPASGDLSVRTAGSSGAADSPASVAGESAASSPALALAAWARLQAHDLKRHAEALEPEVPAARAADACAALWALAERAVLVMLRLNNVPDSLIRPDTPAALIADRLRQAAGARAFAAPPAAFPRIREALAHQEPTP